MAAARLFLERKVYARIRARRGRGLSSGRVLCYHSVGQPKLGVNDVTPRRFREQLELAQRLGYRFVPADRIARGHGAAHDLAVSFDDGLESVARTALPILREYGVPMTVFVVTSWADGSPKAPDAALDWEALGKLAGAGVEIGSHSVTHPDFSKLERDAMKDELVRSREALRSRLGIPSPTFAIPFGQSANWSSTASELAAECGYEIVYAQAVNTRPEGTVPRSFVTAFDDDAVFAALLRGAFDDWEEWIWE